MKLQTPVEIKRSKIRLSPQDKTLVIGSCFADSIGCRMAEAGFDVLVNPFGTLYNPVSIVNGIARLSSGVPFTKGECVRMGAGADLICSFSHHTSFARKTEEEFLENANKELEKASGFWKEATKVILTLGTSRYWEYLPTGTIVSNCLKIDGKFFERKILSVGEIKTLLENMVSKASGKEFIFTVSPIRHKGDGAHGNQLSKSALMLATDSVVRAFGQRCAYFPSYEIMMDELRDYRFYAEDMIHPTAQAENYIWSKFLEFSMEDDVIESVGKALGEKAAQRHRPILGA